MKMKINKERWASFLDSFRYYTEYMSGEYFKDMDSLSQNEFFSKQEGYKNNLLNEDSQKLEYNTWKESTIGTGKISDSVTKAVNGSRNLIDYRQKLLFEEKIKENKKEAERLLYNIYCGTNDAQAFDDAVKFWGGKYDLLGYLFFIKDPNKYLPIRSTIFDAKFEYLGIPLRTAGKCSSKNYFDYVKCIDELRSMIEKYYESFGFKVMYI